MKEACLAAALPLQGAESPEVGMAYESRHAGAGAGSGQGGGAGTTGATGGTGAAGGGHSSMSEGVASVGAAVGGQALDGLQEETGEVPPSLAGDAGG